MARQASFVLFYVFERESPHSHVMEQFVNYNTGKGCFYVQEEGGYVLFFGVGPCVVGELAEEVD
jgi:hypothetical protein